MSLFYFRKIKPVSLGIQKDMNLEIWTSNKGIRRYFVFFKKKITLWQHFFFKLKYIYFLKHLTNLEFLSDNVGAYSFGKLRPYRFWICFWIFGEVSGSGFITSGSGFFKCGWGSQNSISLINAHTLYGRYRQISLYAKESQCPSRFKKL